MTTPPTPIPLTTRTGSRWSAHRLNQPMCMSKAEPSRSNRGRPFGHGSSASPGLNGTPCVPVESQASSLLVILHYLLKNNTTFMEGNGAGLDAPNDPYRPEVAPRQITSAARGYQR